MSLIYIGNNADWIADEWVDYILNNDGERLPKAIPKDIVEQTCFVGNDDFHGREEWDFNDTVCHSYKQEQFPFKLILPEIEETYTDNEWWFVKYNVGKVQPVHQDFPIEDGLNVNRYWMPVQDFKEGHIFWYEDEQISNYKAGDLFKFHKSDAWHAGGNMGHYTRIAFNFTTWSAK